MGGEGGREDKLSQAQPSAAAQPSPVQPSSFYLMKRTIEKESKSATTVVESTATRSGSWRFDRVTTLQLEMESNLVATDEAFVRTIFATVRTRE